MKSKAENIQLFEEARDLRSEIHSKLHDKAKNNKRIIKAILSKKNKHLKNYSINLKKELCE